MVQFVVKCSSVYFELIEVKITRGVAFADMVAIADTYPNLNSSWNSRSFRRLLPISNISYKSWW